MITITRRRSRRFRAVLLAFTTLAAPVALTAAPAAAQEQARERTWQFNIPAQSLPRALASAARTAGVQLIFEDGEPSQIRSRAVRGRMTANEAFRQIAAGTGYEVYYSAPGVVTLRPLPVITAGDDDGSRLLGPVRIEGAEGVRALPGATALNGVNGSTDVTATENTNSYTTGALTVGSKTPRSLLETPASVSVLTAEQLSDQGVSDFTQAMEQLAGVTVIGGNDGRFASRGFFLDKVQIDGGAPISIKNGLIPRFDISLFDHVEMVRGADGLFNGYGEPGGIINLARKRPLDHPQFRLEGQAGSWNNYRVSLDATGPLGFDGRLRGRAVLTTQDQEFFYDPGYEAKTIAFGTLEYDLTPNTVIAAGVSASRQDSVPNASLFRYEDGGDLGLPRRANLITPWARNAFDSDEIFARVEHRFNADWNATLNLSRITQASDTRYPAISGPLDRTTLSGVYYLGAEDNVAENTQSAADLIVSGSFNLWGRTQTLVVGANYSTNNTDDSRQYQFVYLNNPVAVDVFNFDPDDYPDPGRGPLSSSSTENEVTQYGAFANLTITPLDRVHVDLGVRLSGYSNVYEQTYYCTVVGSFPPFFDCPAIGDVRAVSRTTGETEDFSWPPTVSVSYDLRPDVVAYVRYADIYIPQPNTLTRDGSIIDPITGSNVEAGLKWAARGGRLNMAASAYRIVQEGFAAADGPVTPVNPNQSCCFVASDSRRVSTGLDLEVTGELTAGWQISASLTTNRNEYDDPGGANDRIPLITQAPETTFKLWTDYQFQGDGWVRNLSIGGGVTGQTETYVSGGVCPEPLTQGPGYAFCNVAEVPYSFVEPGRAVVSLRAAYQLTPRTELALNVTNVTDETYYQTVGDVYGGNFYGEPRAWMLSLRSRW